MSATHHNGGHDWRSVNVAELAALYLSGAMTPDERRAFEACLAAGERECVAEVQRLRRAAEALCEDVAPMPPPLSVRERILRVIDAEASLQRKTTDAPEQVWRRWDSSADQPLFTLRAEEGTWEETGVAGVQVRRLFVDRPANRMTAMFRMAAGTEYPEHVHDGPEECYVLQGDLHVGDEFVMSAGDYQRALPGSEHGRQWTKNGCTLLVTCSLSDEMT